MNRRTETHSNIDAGLEDALISAVAADPSCYAVVCANLPAVAADAFAARRSTWDELVQAVESGASTVDFAQLAPPCEDPGQAAARLTELHWRRVLTRAAEETLRDLALERPAREVAQALATGMTGARDLVNPLRVGAVIWADTWMNRVTEDLAAADVARAAGLRTLGVASSGLPTLDLILNGWQPGGLYVLGGAPGVGKTSLALQWACEAVAERDIVVVFVTYENSPQNLALKAIGRLGGVSPAAAQRGRADPDRWRNGLERFGALAPRLAFVPADAGTSVDFVESTAREALGSHSGSGLVIVDYLQRMAYGEKFDTLEDNVSALAQRLRDLAVRLDLPVLAVSALAPAADDAPLRLSALAERGELEYASDVVLLLGPRADVGLASAARARSAPNLRLLDLLIAKNRYGEANRGIPLLFRPATGDFQEESLV